jgi:hypothetical protein
MTYKSGERMRMMTIVANRGRFSGVGHFVYIKIYRKKRRGLGYNMLAYLYFPKKK